MAAKNKTKNPYNEKLLGIDYGETNIGLAFGLNDLVSPLKIISGKNTESAISEIARYVIDNKVDKILMGLPITPDGKETMMSRKVRRFSKLLKMRTKKPLEFVNEYRTSEESVTEAVNLGISKKRRRKIDHLSAALIVKEYYSKLPNE
jgi:putative Holliday junction resolvase